MSPDLAQRASDVPDRLAGVLARLDAYPRSVPELLDAVPELICEMVGLLEQLLATHDRLQQLALELRAVPAGPTSPPRAAASNGASPAGAGRLLDALPDTLTRRELEVLRLMADGCTNATIAQRLMIADGTAKKHVVRVLRKLGATNRSEAVGRWFRAGGVVRAAATQE